jgi:excisionase family DNA binding protein
VVRETEMASERLLYRVPEAAESLGLSRAKVNQLIAKGDLASIKIDGARRIPSDDLRGFVDRLRREPAAKPAESGARDDAP